MHWDWRPAPAMVTPFPPRRPAVRRARQGGGDVRARAAGRRRRAGTRGFRLWGWAYRTVGQGPAVRRGARAAERYGIGASASAIPAAPVTRCRGAAILAAQQQGELLCGRRRSSARFSGGGTAHGPPRWAHSPRLRSAISRLQPSQALNRRP